MILGKPLFLSSFPLERCNEESWLLKCDLYPLLIPPFNSQQSPSFLYSTSFRSWNGLAFLLTKARHSLCPWQYPILSIIHWFSFHVSFSNHFAYFFLSMDPTGSSVLKEFSFWRARVLQQYTIPSTSSSKLNFWKSGTFIVKLLSSFILLKN